jgi:phosphosulfolactate synthase (CoM biosynthesis protein A)
MFNQRWRLLLWSSCAIAGIWALAAASHWYFGTMVVTADKVRAYVQSVDFANLTGAARAAALKKLEDQLNALAYEERQRLRMEHFMKDWFALMTEEEKSQFIEATMPTGFKQTIEAFEKLPEEKRHKAIDDAIKRLHTSANASATPASATNSPPISQELEAEIRTIGLKSFYSQSSAQTKAEAAPLLEEMQRQMESGRLLR